MWAALFALSALYAVVLALGRRRRRIGCVGFLHPSSGAGGGGERVLWAALRGLQQRDHAVGVQRTYVLYTASYGPPGSTKAVQDQHLLDLVRTQFGISLPLPLDIVYLRRELTVLLDGSNYPFATLLIQTIVGGLLMFYEVCVVNQPAEVIVDTVGIPFTYLLLRLLCGVPSVAYTHYPVISRDMLQRVQKGEASFNNRSVFARNSVLRAAKVVYYWWCALVYWFSGQFPSVVMVNSSWTSQHIRGLWWPRRCTTVYPPCNAAALCDTTRPLHPAQRTNNIVSVGQFRPEKNHELQLTAFAAALPMLPADTKLLLVGGARNDEDRQRIVRLRARAVELKISDRVEFFVAAPFALVKELLQTSSIGLHTMVDEHFGIVVVEYLASGCVPLAHNSGGVCQDIVTSRDIGRVARSESEYASTMAELLDIKQHRPEEYIAMQARGVAKAQQFSDEAFGEAFCHSIGALLKRLR